MHWPTDNGKLEEIKKSILHTKLEQLGVYLANRPAGNVQIGSRFDQKAEYKYDFFKQNWFENNRKEHEAVREHVEFLINHPLVNF